MVPLPTTLHLLSPSEYYTTYPILFSKSHRPNVGSCVGHLTTLTVSTLYNVDDRMINEHGAVCGMRIGRGNRNTVRKNSNFVHHNSHMAWYRNWATAAAVRSQQLTAWHGRHNTIAEECESTLFSRTIKVTLQTCLREMLASNLRWYTSYPDWGFSCFPQSLQVNAGIVPQLGYDPN
jgi:hypothetical protein